MALTWQNCFSNLRHGKDGSKRGGRTEFEQDYDRIIFSSAFRRLQNKTQVFPLPGSVLVHNRLTHSLEVASVGRSLGKMVGQSLAEKAEVHSNDEAMFFYAHNLKNVIAAACLAHDMGNPAFGHSGEEAIQHFFQNNQSMTINGSTLRSFYSEQEWSDLIHFEGNANTLRLLTNRLYGRLEGGNYRLTFSTLISTVKYPCESIAKDKKHSNIARKKFGFFQSEKETFRQMASACMVQRQSETPLSYYRHPFVYLVEAADDICYNIIDLEDAQRLNIVSHTHTKELLINLILADSGVNERRFMRNVKQLNNDPNELIAYLRAKAINSLTQACSRLFIDHSQQLLEGVYSTPLLEALEDRSAVLNELKKISVEKIYNHKQVVELEIAGFEILGGLLEDFIPAVLSQNPSHRQKKICTLIPTQFSCDSGSSAYNKTMSVLDFISGMTDLYALDMYRQLRGISIHGI